MTEESRLTDQPSPARQQTSQHRLSAGILPLTPLGGSSSCNVDTSTAGESKGLDRECCEAAKRKLSSRIMTVNVRLLDDTTKTFHVQYKASGQVLFDQVCRVLNLLESDYFGLEYWDEEGTKYWLDYEKAMCNQLCLNLEDVFLEFCVKFYTPDPGQLEEEFTRYLFSLQIKRDLAQGILLVHEDTAAVLASYIVQASCGDFSIEDYPDSSYLSCHQFVPRQSRILEEKIMLHHRNHIGQSPSEADMNLLEVARRCEFYGVRLMPAFDAEGVPLTMAVGYIGIVVYRNAMKMNTFSWNKIRKLSFKRKKFLIKLHPTEGYGCYGKDCVEFHFDSRNASKSFWKRCIEHHAFFRCTEVHKACRVRGKTRIFSRGSSFRYSGRTQRQVIEYVRETSARRRSFQRSSSLHLANPGLSPSGVASSYSCSSMTHLHTLQGNERPVSGPPASDNNNEDFSKTTVCLSEPNTPQHRVNVSADNIDKDDTISHESYHCVLNQSLDDPAVNITLPLDTSTASKGAVHDANRESDNESPLHRGRTRAQSRSPEPRLSEKQGRQPRASRLFPGSDPSDDPTNGGRLTRHGSIESNEVPYTLHYRRESNAQIKYKQTEIEEYERRKSQIRRHKSQPREPRSRYRTSPDHERLCRSSSEKRAKVNYARWGELPAADSYSSRDDSIDGTFESEIRERWTEMRRQRERQRARHLWQQRSEIEKSLEAEEAEEALSSRQRLQQQQELEKQQQHIQQQHYAEQDHLLGVTSEVAVESPSEMPPPHLPHEILADFNRAQLLDEAAVEPSAESVLQMIVLEGAPSSSHLVETESDLGARLEHLEGNLEEIELLKELELEAVQQECQRLEETLALNTELKEQYERVLKSEGAEVMSLLQSLRETTSALRSITAAALTTTAATATLSMSSESLVSSPKDQEGDGDDDNSQEDDAARKDLPYSEQSTSSDRGTALQPLDRRKSNTQGSSVERVFSEQGDDFSSLQSTHVPKVSVRDAYVACLQSLLHDPTTAVLATAATATGTMLAFDTVGAKEMVNGNGRQPPIKYHLTVISTAPEHEAMAGTEIVEEEKNVGKSETASPSQQKTQLQREMQQQLLQQPAQQQDQHKDGQGYEGPQLKLTREFCAEIEEFLSKVPSTSERDLTAEITSSLRAEDPCSTFSERGRASKERQIETTSSGLTFVVESLESPDKSAMPYLPHSSSSSSSSGTPPMGRMFIKIKKKRMFAKHEDISDVSSSSSEIRLTLDEFEFLRREIGKGRKIGQVIPESVVSSSEDITFSDETEAVFVGDEPKTLCNSPVSNPHTPLPDPDASLRLSKSSSEDSSINCAHEPNTMANLDLNII